MLSLYVNQFLELLHCSGVDLMVMKERLSLATIRPGSLELTKCASISKIIQDNSSSINYVAGDFNSPNINWQTQSVSGYNYRIELRDMFIDFLANHGLTQMVNFPTHLTYILDLFITNIPSLIIFIL